MKELFNQTQKERYLDRHKIRALFDTKGLDFQLFAYDKGELISISTDVQNFLLFVVSGSIRIYALREDGSKYQLKLLDGFLLLGDVEFGGSQNSHFFVEAASDVHCIALPLRYYREDLYRDNRFLRYLLQSLSAKFSFYTNDESTFQNLEDKLLHFMQHDCAGGQLSGVENAAAHLHCSRRQLQRLLKKLTDSGEIEKVGKGKYKIIADS